MGHLRESTSDHRSRGTRTDDDEVVLSVREVPGYGAAAGVFQVTLRADEHLQQTHKQHEGGSAAGAGQRWPWLRHRAVAVHLQTPTQTMNEMY